MFTVLEFLFSVFPLPCLRCFILFLCMRLTDIIIDTVTVTVKNGHFYKETL